MYVSCPNPCQKGYTFTNLVQQWCLQIKFSRLLLSAGRFNSRRKAFTGSEKRQVSRAKGCWSLVMFTSQVDFTAAQTKGSFMTQCKFQKPTLLISYSHPLHPIKYRYAGNVWLTLSPLVFLSVWACLLMCLSACPTYQTNIERHTGGRGLWRRTWPTC